ncbi:MAG: cell division protein SepF [Syntrophomonadaceae bacterium]|nr:cell division protein SepF [Syntrophomonadaceae bacterium]
MGVMDSVWKWLGVQSEVEEEYEFESRPVPLERDNRATANVVALHTAGKGAKVVVCEPARFEEVQALVDHLKNRKQVIVNFENTPPELSQKIIDFVSGAVYALDGHSQQLGQNIFLFAPSSVEITSDSKNLMRKNDFFKSDPFGGKQ